MCVIIACETNFPTQKTLDLAEKNNGHGGGIAWLMDNKVYYVKGLTAKQIGYMLTYGNIQLPAVIHFRIGTCGGYSKELTHPFPISDQAELNLSGVTEEVLFHNGIWAGWEQSLINLCAMEQIKIPDGDFTDSRTLALYCKYLGHNFLRFVNGFNKFVILTTKGIEYYGSDWHKVDNTICSNNYFTIGNYCSTKDDKELLDNHNDIDEFNRLGNKVEKFQFELRECSKELSKQNLSKKRTKKLKRRIERLENKILELRNKKEDIFQNSKDIDKEIDEYDDKNDKNFDYNGYKDEYYRLQEEKFSW